MPSIARSRSIQIYRKLILLSAITAITDSAISLRRWRNSSRPKMVFRTALMLSKRSLHSNGGLGIGRRQFRINVAPLSSILATSMPAGISRVRIGACAVFPEALATADWALAWVPANRDLGLVSMKAEIFLATGDLQAMEPLLANPRLDPTLQAVYALFQRRYAAAIVILSNALATKTDRSARNTEKLLLGLTQQ